MPRILTTPLQFETLLFKAISGCFPRQIGGHLQVYKMAEGDERNTIHFRFLRLLRWYWVLKGYIYKKGSSKIFEANIKNDPFFRSIGFFNC